MCYCMISSSQAFLWSTISYINNKYSGASYHQCCAVVIQCLYNCPYEYLYSPLHQQALNGLCVCTSI